MGQGVEEGVGGGVAGLPGVAHDGGNGGKEDKEI
jgi:hypothetical protein